MNGGGLLGGMGVDPMARFLPTNTAMPNATAPNLGAQAMSMGVGQRPGLMAQIGQGAGRFMDAYGSMQGIGQQQQPMQAPGLAQTGGGMMQAPTMQQPMQQPQATPTADYMAMLDQIIAGAFD